jgi:2-polyprenyl-3-methyl-5-hydroxy-6-metoxy-1,4-benzoquinol methylase
LVSNIVVHRNNQQIFDDAASYYQDLRWFKTRLTRFEYDLTRQVLLEELSVSPGNRVLEVGCGPGTWTREVAPLVGHVTALDISAEMIDRARQYVQEGNVTYVHTDVAQYQLTEVYDAVFSVRVVEYLENWEPEIRRLLGAVAPGGRAVIVTKTPISVWRGTGRNLALGRAIRRAQRRLRNVPQPEDQPFWQRYISPTALVKTFHMCGLERVQVRPVIYGLPIFMRGTKQYPLVPESLEPLALSVFSQGWKIADALPPHLRPLGLVFAESYAVSGIRP